VAAEIARELSREEPLEIAERGAELLDRAGRPRLRIEFLDGATHGRDRTHLHGVRHIVIGAPVLHLIGCRSRRGSVVGESVDDAPLRARAKFSDTGAFGIYMSNVATTGA